MTFMAFAVAAVVAMGCGSNDDGGGSTNSADSGGKPAKIAYLSYAYTDYSQAEEQGMKAGVKDTGGSVKVFNANFDPQKLLKDCQDAVTSGRFNAFVIAPVDHVSAIPCVKAAKAAGIPVATIEGTIGTDPARTYDINPQVDGVVAVNTVPMQTQADAQAEMIKQACEGKDPCEVIAEVATPSDPLTNDVIKAVQQQVPNMKVVAKFGSLYDPGQVTKKLPDLLAAHPGTDVFFSAADSSALAAVPVLKSAGMTDKVVLIGNGGSRLGAKAVADGTIYGSVANWPQQGGQGVAEALTEAVNGKKVTNCCVDQLKMDTPVVLTKDTVGDFTAEWGAQ